MASSTRSALGAYASSRSCTGYGTSGAATRRIAASRAVAAERLEEEHRIRIADRGEEQALYVVRRRRRHHLQPRRVGEVRLERVGMQLGRAHPGAIGRTDGHLSGQAAGGAVT